MPTAYVLINSDLGSDQSIINELKQILDGESGIEYYVQGVYGVYDIILKITSDNVGELRSVITHKVRKINKVQSTLTMMVIDEQENL
ncbi:MAG: Lrp/AsnC ligand binding domain-containing protein [Nitrosopumilaceae archaeon]